MRDVFFRSKLKSEPADECGGVEALPRIMRDSAVAVEVTLIAVETDAAPIPDTGRLVQLVSVPDDGVPSAPPDFTDAFTSDATAF